MESQDVVFTAARQAALTTSPVPDPGPGQVTLRALTSLISTGTECWCFRGQFDADTGWANWVRYPFRPGYSLVSEVVATGPDVTTLALGQRVFSQDAHREYVTSDVSRLVVVPAETSTEEAAWGALSFIVQTGVRRGEVSLGGSAVVIGCGLLGQLAVQYLRVAGLRDVLVIDTAEPRLQMAAAHGATACFQGSAADASEFVHAHLAGRLADVVFDVTGHWAVLPLALKLVRDFGTVVLLGDTPHPSKQTLTHDVLTRQLRIVGTHNAKLSGEAAWWTAERQMGLFWQYLQRGQMRVTDLVTHRLDPREPQAAYTLLEAQRDQVMGVLFDWRALTQ